MGEKELYTDSILTFAFTNDGRLVVRKDKDGKLDTLPWLFMGYRNRDSKPNYEDSIWVISNTDDYKEKIASFFAYHLGGASNAMIDGFLDSNEDYLLDVGELYEKIADHQIEEMKTLHNPSYIRVNCGLYDVGTNQNGKQIINRIETRYVVLPSDEDIEKFPKLEAKEIDELKENFDSVSDKVILGIIGKDGNIMESFVNQLKSPVKGTFPKK